jgi:hypothetical protein
MSSPDIRPGALTREAAKALTVPEVLRFVCERLWLVTTRLASAANLLDVRVELADAQLQEAEGALADVVVALRSVFATILHTDAADAHSGVVVVEDSAWMWRQMVCGLRADLGTLPKAVADARTDLGTLESTVRLTARAFGAVARRAAIRAPAQRQLALVEPTVPEEPPREACPGCGAVEFPHRDGCPHEATLAAHALAACEAKRAAEAEGWTFRGWMKGKGFRATLQHITDPATTLEVFGRNVLELRDAIRRRESEVSRG